MHSGNGCNRRTKQNRRMKGTRTFHFDVAVVDDYNFG